jgi:3,4-dihydroxy-2-butanone 4-phosphate synthase
MHRKLNRLQKAHNLSIRATAKKATCTTNRIDYVKCSNTGCTYENDAYEVEGTKTGHSYVRKMVPGTNKITNCEVGGINETAEYCKDCGVEKANSRQYAKIVPEETHCYSVQFYWDAKDPKAGKVVIKCTNNVMDAFNAAVDENGKEITCSETHTIYFTDAEKVATIKEGSCKTNTNGSARFEKVVYFENIAYHGSQIAEVAPEHTITVYPAVAATCKTSGKTKGEYCTVCEKWITPQETVPTLEHTPAVVKGWEATCQYEGLSDGKICSACGEILEEQKKLEVIAHTPEAIGEAVDATCTSTGITAGSRCTVCKEVLEARSIIPMVPHTVITNAAKEATCTEAGYTSATVCSECGKVITAANEIPALGHKAGTVKKENIVKATSTKNGSYYENTYCSVCGKKISSVKKTIVKQSILTKATSKTYTVAAVKSAKRSFAIGATAKRAKITYKKVSGSSALTLSSTGVVTVKKGTKKGTYTMKVTINASASTGYAAATKTVTIKVVVK